MATPQLSSQPLTNALGGRLATLVENKITMSHEIAELHLYETFERASLVELTFDQPVLTSMLSGKKVMHLPTLDPFAYLPGESLLLPAHQSMQIDFPEATAQHPTRCMALTLSQPFIQDTVAHFNEQVPRAEPGDVWRLNTDNVHLQNDFELKALLQKLIRLFKETGPLNPFFIQHSVKELVIRLMQTPVRAVLLNETSRYVNTHRLAFVVDYIRQNLTRTLPVDELCNKACLSKSHFFRLFKMELGISPTQFILTERIRLAKQILLNPAKSITDACYESGFNSQTHFSSAFRAIERMSPRQFKRLNFKSTTTAL